MPETEKKAEEDYLYPKPIEERLSTTHIILGFALCIIVGTPLLLLDKIKELRNKI